MKILILEDDLVQQQYFKRLIMNYIKENNWYDTTVFETARPNELLEIAAKNTSYNIYFLDIEIKGQRNAGFELAKSIRKVDPFGWIVFVTTHSEFLPITFKYKLTALDFIDKSFSKAEFNNRVIECLETAYQKRDSLADKDMFIFKNKQSNFQTSFAEILFFETTELTHKIRLITTNTYTEFYSTLSEIEKMDNRLFKCHKSYVVNLQNIQKVDRVNKTLQFKNNEQCFVSRSKMKPLLEKMDSLHQSSYV